MSRNSEIIWSSSLVAIPEMCYESIDPLYSQSDDDGESFGFALSCSRHFSDPKGCPGCIHKLEVNPCPDFEQAKMEITHEVLPGLGACSQILTVNQDLKVACFDSGTVIPVKNFGYKKTFNSDVRAGLQHHMSPINCLATDSNGRQLASGSTNGDVVLYQVRGEQISFLSRSAIATTCITGLAYIQPNQYTSHRPEGHGVLRGENMLIYSTHSGHIGLLDTRCKLGAELQYSVFHTTEPRLNITSLCCSTTQPGQVVFFGTLHGQIFSLDLRDNRKFLHHQDNPEDICIRRIKEISVQESNNEVKTFLAYTNNTREIKIMDSLTMRSDQRWKCDRLPEANQKDFCQIGNRIVTCGSQTSIGCWEWQD